MTVILKASAYGRRGVVSRACAAFRDVTGVGSGQGVVSRALTLTMSNLDLGLEAFLETKLGPDPGMTKVGSSALVPSP